MWLMMRHFFSEHRGTDTAGNRYFESRFKDAMKRSYRWVSYARSREASSVPALWHGWLHHTIKTVPDVTALKALSWIKPHRPNLTGTGHALLPKAHLAHGAGAVTAPPVYQAWQPTASDARLHISTSASLTSSSQSTLEILS